MSDHDYIDEGGQRLGPTKDEQGNPLPSPSNSVGVAGPPNPAVADATAQNLGLTPPSQLPANEITSPVAKDLQPAPLAALETAAKGGNIDITSTIPGSIQANIPQTPTPPAAPWDTIASHDDYKKLSPEDKGKFLSNYVSDLRDYLYSQPGVGADEQKEIQGRVESLWAKENDKIQQETNTGDFLNRFLFKTGTSVNSAEQAGLRLIESTLGHTTGEKLDEVNKQIDKLNTDLPKLTGREKDYAEAQLKGLESTRDRLGGGDDESFVSTLAGKLGLEHGNAYILNRRAAIESAIESLSKQKTDLFTKYYGVNLNAKPGTEDAVAGALSNVMDMAMGSKLMLLKMAGTTYEGAYENALQQNGGDKIAAAQSAGAATRNAVPLLVAYAAGGKLAGMAGNFLPKGASPILRGLFGGTASAAANLTVSGLSRKAQGENFIGDTEQNLTDVLFGAVGGFHEFGRALDQPTKKFGADVQKATDQLTTDNALAQKFSKNGLTESAKAQTEKATNDHVAAIQEASKEFDTAIKKNGSDNPLVAAVNEQLEKGGEQANGKTRQSDNRGVSPVSESPEREVSEQRTSPNGRTDEGRQLEERSTSGARDQTPDAGQRHGQESRPELQERTQLSESGGGQPKPASPFAEGFDKHLGQVLAPGWRKSGDFYEFRESDGGEHKPSEIAKALNVAVTKDRDGRASVGIPYHMISRAVETLKEKGLWTAPETNPEAKRLEKSTGLKWEGALKAQKAAMGGNKTAAAAAVSVEAKRQQNALADIHGSENFPRPQGNSVEEVAHNVRRDLNKQIKLPKGASAIRVVDEKGRKSIVPERDLKGANPLHEAGPFKKVEAGTIGRRGEFVPMKEQITMPDLASPSTEDGEAVRSEVTGSEQAHQKATAAGIRDALQQHGAQVPADLDDKISANYAHTENALNDFNLQDNTEARDVLYDKLRKDMLDNVEKTGSPFKAQAQDGREVEFNQLHRAKNRLLDFTEKHENAKRGATPFHGTEDQPGIEDRIAAEEKNPSEIAAEEEPKRSMAEEVRRIHARALSAFTKWVGVPTDAAPGATRDQVLKAATLVIDDILEKNAGFRLQFEKFAGRGRPGPVDKLRGDPAFIESVRQRAYGDIQQDVRALIGKGRDLSSPDNSDGLELKHVADMVKSGLRVEHAVRLLPEETRARTKAVAEKIGAAQGINGVLEKIVKESPETAEGMMQRELAKVLAKSEGPNTPVIVDPTLQTRTGSQGVFSTKHNAIYVSPELDSNTRAWVLLHEQTHNIVSTKVEHFVRGNFDLLTDQDISALKDLDALRRRASEHPDVPDTVRNASQAPSTEESVTLFKQGRQKTQGSDLAKLSEHYGLINLHEFVAETLTNPDFQKFLNGIDVDAGARRPASTVLDSVKRLLRRLIFGYEKVREGSVLTEAFDRAIDLVKKGPLENQLVARLLADRLESPADRDQAKAKEDYAFADEFAKEHGFDDAEEMALKEPRLFNEVTPDLASPAKDEKSEIEKAADKLIALHTDKAELQKLADRTLKSDLPGELKQRVAEKFMRAAAEIEQKANTPPQAVQKFAEAKEDISKNGATPESLNNLVEAKQDLPPVQDPAKPSAQALNLIPHYLDVNDALSQHWEKAKAFFKARNPKEFWAAWLNAADNTAKVFSEQKTNDIRGALREAMGRKLGEDITKDANALSIVVESQGNRERLAQFRKQVVDAQTNPQVRKTFSWMKAANSYLGAIDHAEKNWDRLQSVAEKYKKVTDEQLALEHLNGLNSPQRDGYVPHVQDLDELSAFLSSSGSGSATGFKKMRTHDTFADSLAAGVKPKSLDAVDLLNNRLRKGNTFINRQKWAEAGQAIIDPTTNKPVVTEALPVTHPVTGAVQYDVPLGYQLKSFGNRMIAVHNGYADFFGTLTGESALRKNPVFNAALKTEGTIKHGLLLFDTFHLGRLTYYSLPYGLDSVSYRKGLLTIDYSDKELQNMERRGELPKGVTANDLISRKADANLLLSQGLNVGSIAEAMNADFIRTLPFFGRVNKFIFEQFQRGAVTQVGLIELARQRKAFPELSHEEIARRVSKDINTRFGNLLKEGWFKSDTLRDMAMLTFLAPSWNEGLLKSELGFYKQTGESAIDLAKTGKFRMGTMMKGSGTLLLGGFMMAQAINLMTRHQFTWQNQEEGLNAKLSAYIPDVIGDGPGFFFNPLALPTELSHQLLGEMDRGKNIEQAAMQVLGYKLSPFGHAALTAKTGQDRFGKSLNTRGEYWGEIFSDVLPLPISLFSLGKAAYGSAQAGHVTEPFKGAIGKQVAASGGVKLDSAPSPTTRMKNLANDFNKSKGITPDPRYSTSDFSGLTQALNTNDEKRAHEELDKLHEKKTARQINVHYRRQVRFPFTGNPRREREFYNSLTNEQRETYDHAIDERQKLRDKYQALNPAQ